MRGVRGFGLSVLQARLLRCHEIARRAFTPAISELVTVDSLRLRTRHRPLEPVDSEEATDGLGAGEDDEGAG